MKEFLFANPQFPQLLLRFGLAATLLYAGISSLVTPDDWIGYLPDTITNFIDGELFLTLFALYQLALAAWLLSGLYVHIAALLCAATLGGILVGNPSLLEITFRDAGLAIAAVALAALTWPKK